VTDDKKVLRRIAINLVVLSSAGHYRIYWPSFLKGWVPAFLSSFQPE
jgi:hypothetical protein